MARGRGNFETDLRHLITRVTGFREEDEQFQLCWQFSVSNVKHHRYLDVDSHKLNRTLDGMVTKLRIHSQDRKADILQGLFKEFLNSPEFGNGDSGKTDTQYAILLLLLKLADSPTNADYVETPKKKQTEVEDEFDWKAYLLDGEDVDKEMFAESPDISDDEDFQGSQTRDQDESHDHIMDQSYHPAIANAEYITTDDISVLDTGLAWLRRNIMVQYWSGDQDDCNVSGHCTSNLCRDWENYEMRTNPLYSIPQDTKITETQLVRELIWMLSGVKDLFICQYVGREFLLRGDFSMPHLTKQSLSSLLQSFLEHGKHVQILQNFVSDVATQGCHGNLSEPHLGVSRTHQAFTQWLSRFLQDFRKHLCHVEKVIIQQDETFTIPKLRTTIQAWLQKVEVVYDIFFRGTRDGTLKGDNTELASHLLCIMYEAVLEYDNAGEESDLESILLPMWIQTSRPYLDIIDEWVTNGNLIDPRKEFLIQRNEAVKSLDENFWQTAFSLNCAEMSSSEERELSISKGPNQSTDVLSESQLQNDSHWLPKFLHPILKEVILAGKSMELLQNLGRLGEVIGNKEGTSQSWYCTFIESLRETLGGIPQPAAPPADGHLHHRETTGEIFTAHISQQMLVKGTHDPLLLINFAAIFDAHTIRVEDLTTETSRLEENLSQLNVLGLQPIDVVLRRCLYPYLHHRYKRVCLKVVEVLKDEYHLLDYLASMRRFFLMEAGDMMFDFYTQLFNKVQSHEAWRDYYSLNLMLQEALQTHHPGELTRLTLDITEKSHKAKDSNPINAFDGLILNYKVPWPVDVVISSKTQAIYNQVFIFLLQIKYAKHSLDELRFSALERENLLKTLGRPEDMYSMETLEVESPRKYRIHRTQLLRMRLINFVNSLHNYIMTRILHSTGLEFLAEIRQAEDLDQIIAIHHTYSSTIHDRCLQHRGVAFLRDTVLKVLNLCVVFSARWQQGVDEINLQCIESMELEFSRCIQFLSSFLNNVVKRGSFPHLEPLAFALINSLEQIKT